MKIEDIKKILESNQLKCSKGFPLGTVKVTNVQWFFSYKNQIYYNAELLISGKERCVMLRAIANDRIDLIACGETRKMEECKHWTIEQVIERKPESIISF